jgi:hypothetical protein
MFAVVGLNSPELPIADLIWPLLNATQIPLSNFTPSSATHHQFFPWPSYRLQLPQTVCFPLSPHFWQTKAWLHQQSKPTVPA